MISKELQITIFFEIVSIMATTSGEADRLTECLTWIWIGIPFKNKIKLWETTLRKEIIYARKPKNNEKFT